MAWVTTTQLKEKIGGFRHRRLKFAANKVTFATDVKTQSIEKRYYTMRVTLPIDVCYDAGIVPKDKVFIAFDVEKRLGLVSKARTAGHVIGLKHKRFEVKEAWCDGMPSVASTVECDCWNTREGIVFRLPDCASFTRNLRADAYEIDTPNDMRKTNGLPTPN